MSPLDASTTESGSETIVEITPAALDIIRGLRAEETDPDTLGLRMAIISGPGEDFRYDLSFDEYLTAGFTDEVRTIDGLKIIVPADSVELLSGATLDHTETQGLVIRNPNSPRPIVVDGLTTDDALSAEIEAIVSTEVNPALAAHGGFVTYVGHDGDGVAYMTMGGGCHGCSMSKTTMMEGVQTMIVDGIEPITEVRDLTDHTTGSNPYYA
ncbi:MAG: NifU family protein [Ilumatobacteraceae bacterium]